MIAFEEIVVGFSDPVLVPQYGIYMGVAGSMTSLKIREFKKGRAFIIGVSSETAASGNVVSILSQKVGMVRFPIQVMTRDNGGTFNLFPVFESINTNQFIEVFSGEDLQVYQKANVVAPEYDIVKVWVMYENLEPKKTNYITLTEAFKRKRNTIIVSLDDLGRSSLTERITNAISGFGVIAPALFTENTEYGIVYVNSTGGDVTSLTVIGECTGNLYAPLPMSTQAMQINPLYDLMNLNNIPFVPVFKGQDVRAVNISYVAQSTFTQPNVNIVLFELTPKVEGK